MHPETSALTEELFHAHAKDVVNNAVHNTDLNSLNTALHQRLTDSDFAVWLHKRNRWDKELFDASKGERPRIFQR